MKLLISVFAVTIASVNSSKVITPNIRYQLEFELQLWTSVSKSSYFTIESSRVLYAKYSLAPPYKYDIGNYSESNITLISGPITFIWNQIPISTAAIEVEKLILSEDAYLNDKRLITNCRYFEPMRQEIWTRKPMKFYRRSNQDKIMECMLSVSMNFLDSEAEYVNSFNANIYLIISKDLNYTLAGIWMTTRDMTITEKISEFPFSIKTLMDDRMKISWNAFDTYQELKIASVAFDEHCNDDSMITLKYYPSSLMKLPPNGEQVLIRGMPTPVPTTTETPVPTTTETPIPTTTETPIPTKTETLDATTEVSTTEVSTTEESTTTCEDKTTELMKYPELTTLTDTETVILDMITTMKQIEKTPMDSTTIDSVTTMKTTTDGDGRNTDDDHNEEPLGMKVSSGNNMFHACSQIHVIFAIISALFIFKKYL